MSTRRTDALPADASLEARIAAAARDGHDTAAAGEPRRNPWRGDADTAVERLLSAMWARGYTSGHPF